MCSALAYVRFTPTATAKANSAKGHVCKADMRGAARDVRYGPIADLATFRDRSIYVRRFAALQLSAQEWQYHLGNRIGVVGKWPVTAIW